MTLGAYMPAKFKGNGRSHFNGDMSARIAMRLEQKSTEEEGAEVNQRLSFSSQTTDKLDKKYIKNVRYSFAENVVKN